MPADLLPADERRRIVSASLALGATVGLFGAVFGVGSVAAGASVLQTCVISLLVFTGASQFSAVSVVATGGGTAAALGGALLLAGRNTVYGLAMSRVISGSVAHRLLAAQFVIDETTALATTQTVPAAKRLAFWATGLTLYGFWNVGTLLGALVGSAIDPTRYGLDVAIPAGFVAMVMPHLRHRLGLLAGVLGAGICLALVPFAPAGVPVLGAAAAVLIGLPARRPDASADADIPTEPLPL